MLLRMFPKTINQSMRMKLLLKLWIILNLNQFMFLWTKRRNNSIFCRSLIQITVIFILLFASSCDDTYDKVGGTWVIKKAIINNQEVPIYKFISNMIIFEKNGNCRVPSYDALEKDASWKIIKFETNGMIKNHY